MKTFPGSLALVVVGAVLLYGIGIAAAGAGAPAKAGMPCPGCPGCPQSAADNSAPPPMADRMKTHVEGMKSALAALRESEKTLAGTEDPKAFRAAVIEHLKKLDDLQASHLTHMESMMERMPGGMHGMDRGRCPDCKCGECSCKDHMGKDGSHGSDCRCRCGCCKESGHTH